MGKHMKKLVTLTTLAVLAISSITTAMPIMPPINVDTRILTYDLLDSSEVSQYHVAKFIGGSAEINYAANTVSLKFFVAPECMKGLSCPEVLRVETIELPITSITSDNECYVTVNAHQDARPVDGMLQQISIDDFTNSTCAFLVKPISDIKYLTSFYDRIHGHESTTISNLKVDLINETVVERIGEFYNLTGGKYIKGFAKTAQVSSGSLSISENIVHLEVYDKSDCPVGAMCLVGPKVLVADFTIHSRETKVCVEIIKASAMTMGAGQNVVIKSYANSPCDIMPKNLITVDYTSTMIVPKNKGPNQVARFFFDYAVMPFQK